MHLSSIELGYCRAKPIQAFDRGSRLELLTQNSSLGPEFPLQGKATCFKDPIIHSKTVLDCVRNTMGLIVIVSEMKTISVVTLRFCNSSTHASPSRHPLNSTDTTLNHAIAMQSLSLLMSEPRRKAILSLAVGEDCDLGGDDHAEKDSHSN